jgi:hypothetical protein
MEFNLSEGVSSGAVGFRVEPRTSQHAEHGIPIALELHSDFVRCATGYRVLFPLRDPRVRICAGATFGWWGPPEPSATGLRSSRYYAGIEGRLMIPLGRLEAEAACSVEPVATVITLHPLGMERSHVQDRSVLVGVRFEPVLRMGFVEKLPGGRIRKSGLGIGLAAEPKATVLVPFDSPPPASDRALSLRLFLFGEVLGDPEPGGGEAG